jgi:predicted dehydrogenase
VRAVIIGTSGHIDLALSVRDRLPELEFVGLAPGSSDENAREFFVDRMEPALIPYYEEYRRMLDREKPDVAVVAPFFSLQAGIACECMQRGIHVFVEKPMAVTLEELDMLRRVQAARAVAICPMLPYRYNPEFQAAFAAVTEGLVGEPLIITAQKSYKIGARHPMYTRRSTYGGTIPWVAIHAIDWVYWFSRGGITEVTAGHTTKGNRGHGELESSGALFYRLSNTGSASVSFDYFRPGGAPTHGDDRLRVAGDRGVVEIMGDDATILTDDAPSRKLARGEQRSIFEEFIRSLKGEARLLISSEEAFAVSELALKSREAADTRKAIRFR